MNKDILKEKSECYLCSSKNDLTFHHIIPLRKFKQNNSWNIMILCRKCHNLIDANDNSRNENCYNGNKIKIDKYNDFLKEKDFDKELIWTYKIKDTSKIRGRGKYNRPGSKKKNTERFKKLAEILKIKRNNQVNNIGGKE
jgi:uncharacterized CHY-type Zn-finger protein